MKLNFTKMHGCGNDYIYINCFRHSIDDPSALAKKLTQRHFYIGADGLILIYPSEVADARMRLFNSDGAESELCGNGIRCAAKFIYDNGISKNDPLTIETPAGIKTIDLHFKDGKVSSATVELGVPSFDPADVPVKPLERIDGPIIGRSLFVGGHFHKVTCLSMGNPHCVLFVPESFNLNNFDIESAGIRFERDSIFPEGVNTEFVRFVDESHLELRVWERHVGEPWASVSGTCAAVIAACENGYCKKGSDVHVKVRGGVLTVRYTDGAVYMTGDTVESFTGEMEI